MTRLPLALALAVAAAPALAGPVCTFTTECYMDLPCEETDWEVIVDRDAGVLTTMVEDLEILHVEPGEPPQILARGMGTLNLLTLGGPTSVLTVHIGAAPAAITYLGECVEQ